MRQSGAQAEPGNRPDLSRLTIEHNRRPDEPRRSRWKRLVVSVVAAMSLSALGYLAYASRSAVRITTFVVDRSANAAPVASVTASGYVEAERRADIAPQITARIVELPVTEGMFVPLGGVIAVLEAADIRAKLSGAEAEWKLARAERARAESLETRALLAPAQLDRAVATEDAALAKLNELRAQLDFTVIRAPFAGVVTHQRARVGEAISPFASPLQQGSSNAAIVTLVDLRSVYVGAEIAEANIAGIREGQPASITLPAYASRVYRGRVLRILPTGDRRKGTVKVKVGFEDPDDHVLPDLSARVTIETGSSRAPAEPTLRIPKSAIATLEGQTGVYVVSGDVASFRPIRLGGKTEGEVEIFAGIGGGERLVSDVSAIPALRRVRVKTDE